VGAPPLPSVNVANIDEDVIAERTGRLGAGLALGIVGRVTIADIVDVKLLGVSQKALPEKRILPTPVDALWFTRVVPVLNE
jgi:hypothetical protein